MTENPANSFFPFYNWLYIGIFSMNLSLITVVKHFILLFGYCIFLITYYKNCMFFSITACANYQADLVFVVDSSGSIRDQNPADNSYDNWNLILEYVYDVVALMPIGSNNVRVGLVVYSQYGINAFRLNT